MTDRLIRAPWSSEQVAALEQFQVAGNMHPFTCGNDRHALPPRLVPSHSGWYCPDPSCEYTQDWAHAFMADPTSWPRPFGERHGPTPAEARTASFVGPEPATERKVSSGGFTGISLAGRWECGNCGATGDGWYDQEDGLVLHDENGQPFAPEDHDCDEEQP